MFTQCLYLFVFEYLFCRSHLCSPSYAVNHSDKNISWQAEMIEVRVTHRRFTFLVNSVHDKDEDEDEDEDKDGMRMFLTYWGPNLTTICLGNICRKSKTLLGSELKGILMGINLICWNPGHKRRIRNSMVWT